MKRLRIPSGKKLVSCVLAVSGTVGCGNSGTPEEPAVDRATGRKCFELHLDRLPPGSQYEGVEHLAAGLLQIRVMTGVELTIIGCALTADGVVTISNEVR